MGFGFFKSRKKDEAEAVRLPPAEPPVSSKKVADIIGKIGYEIIENKDFLTNLDSPIGDCDCGINLARGFQAVVSKLLTLEDTDIGTILKTVGMTLVSTVGGVSGPLYGTLFMRMGANLTGKAEINFEEFIAALEYGIEGVKIRGKSSTGEKTMLDAMVPACEAMKHAWANERNAAQALHSGVKSALAGCEATKEMVATKGRASYLGEKSLGHMDPGAASFAVMLGAVEQEMKS